MIRKPVSNFVVEVRGRRPVSDILSNKHRKGWVRSVPITSDYQEKPIDPQPDEKHILPNLNEVDPLSERLAQAAMKRKRNKLAPLI